MASTQLVVVVAAAAVVAGCATVTGGRHIKRYEETEATGRVTGKALPSGSPGLSVASVELTDDALAIILETKPDRCVAPELDVIDVYEVTERSLEKHGKVIFGIELGCTALMALVGLTFITGAFQDPTSSSPLTDLDPTIAGATSFGIAGACALGSVVDIAMFLDSRKRVRTGRKVVGYRPARCAPEAVANSLVEIGTCLGEEVNLKTDEAGVVRLPIEVLVTPALDFCAPLVTASVEFLVHRGDLEPAFRDRGRREVSTRVPTLDRVTEEVVVPISADVAASLARRVDRRETYAHFLERFPRAALRIAVEKRIRELEEIERRFWDRIEAILESDDSSALVTEGVTYSSNIPGSDAVLIHAAMLKRVRETGDAGTVRERLRSYLRADLPDVLRRDARRRLIHWTLAGTDTERVAGSPESWFVDLPPDESLDVYAELDSRGRRVASLERGAKVSVLAKGKTHWLLLVADPDDLGHRKPLVAWIPADRLTHTDLAAEDARAAAFAECEEMLHRAGETIAPDRPDTMLATLDARIDDARLSCGDLADLKPWETRFAKLKERRARLAKKAEAMRAARTVTVEINGTVYAGMSHAEARRELRALRKRTDARIWRAALSTTDVVGMREDIGDVYVETFRKLLLGYHEVVRLERAGGGARAKEMRRAMERARRSLCLVGKMYTLLGGTLGSLKGRLLGIMKSGFGGGEGTAIFRFLTTGKCK